MYAVVGCGNCDALWVVEWDDAETAECPRCGRRHRRANLRPLARTPDADAARDARTALLAERQGHADAADSLPGFGDPDDRVREAVVPDEEYLASAGIDPGEVDGAGERAGSSGGGGRRAVVLRAVREGDAPTEAAVVESAADRGVDPAAARETLSGLVHEGAVTETDGRYRVV